jgi:ACS family tartrate transporter-like MFS transporter
MSGQSTDRRVDGAFDRAQDGDLARATIRKVERRLVPFCMLLFVVSFLDRINIGFAALQMNQALGIGAEAFGAGVGIFFIGYFLFEVPSNLILHKVGARVWIARIVISWGALTALHVFISGATSFYLLRFLLGLAEAGFAPGLLFYFTLWFPARYRGSVMSRYLTSSAIAVVIGAPLSTSLFHLSGVFGVAGWQWMFLIEGGLGVVLGVICLGYLTDRPEEARWLNEAERGWLIGALQREPSRRAIVPGAFRAAMGDGKVWLLTFMFFTFGLSSYGIIFWLPQIVKQLSGVSTTEVGFITALPWIAAIIVMTLVGRSSDHFGERHLHFAGSCLVGAVGLAGSVMAIGPVGQLLFIGLGAVGIWSALGVFWTIPQQMYGGTAAAGVLALINSIGNLGGFVGPTMMGWARARTGDFASGLIGLALVLVAGAVAAAVLKYATPRGARVAVAGAK